MQAINSTICESTMRSYHYIWIIWDVKKFKENNTDDTHVLSLHPIIYPIYQINLIQGDTSVRNKYVPNSSSQMRFVR
jgi:hypothetical protein